MISPEDRHEYVNLAYILEVADGDEGFIKESINTYLSSIPENIKVMIAGVNAHDCAKVSFQAHTLKGAFNFIGNARLADLCDTLELNCHNEENHHLVPALIAEIIPLANKTVAELQTVLVKLQVK